MNKIPIEMEENCHDYGIRYLIATGSENIPYGTSAIYIHYSIGVSYLNTNT